jgi:hypothetical protein
VGPDGDLAGTVNTVHVGGNRPMKIISSGDSSSSYYNEKRQHIDVASVSGPLEYGEDRDAWKVDVEQWVEGPSTEIESA